MPAIRVAGLPSGGTAVQLLSSTGTVLERAGPAADLLVLAHRDEHRLELVLEPVDLASVATAVTNQLRTLADQGGVHLTVRASHVPSLLADRLASPRSSPISSTTLSCTPAPMAPSRCGSGAPPTERS